MGNEHSKRRTISNLNDDDGSVPSLDKKKKKNNKDEKLSESMEEQKQVGYIMDMSDTEKQWNEKQENKEEEPEEKKEEEPEEVEEPQPEIKIHCKLCNKNWMAKECYSLETCGHKFCFECIKEFLVESIDVSVKDMPICPHNNCDAPISLGDLKRALETFRAEEDEELKNSKENPIDPHISEIRESVGVFNVSLTKSLESFVDQMDFLVKCPSCKLIFEKVPLSATDSRFKEVVKDDKGNKIEGEPLHHYLENRFRCRNCTTIFCCQCLTSPYHLGYTCRGYLDSLHRCKCRYCQEPVAEGCSFYNPAQQNETWVTRWKKRRIERKNRAEIDIDLTDKAAIEEFISKREAGMEAAGQFFVCDEEECQTKASQACLHVTKCGHLCGGVRDEENHLQCLKDDCATGDVTADDYCNICWVEDLASAPSVELSCGHIFHYGCIKQRVDGGYQTPYITFKFANCPLCDTKINHPLLDTREIRELEVIMRDLGKRRLKAELMLDDPELQEGGEYHGKEEDYALLRFAFYKCAKCRKPYFGGRKACDAGDQAREENFNAQDLICPGCAGFDGTCATHGTDYIEFKCRFCCALATYFCGGAAHFCTPCHDVAGEKVNFGDWSTKWEGVVECPGYEKCPLGIPHAMNGEEACLGCAMCRAQ